MGVARSIGYRIRVAVVMVATLAVVLAVPGLTQGALYYPVTSWPEPVKPLANPRDVAIDASGTAFIADTRGRRIVVVASGGTFAGAFFGAEEPWARLSDPRSLALGPDGLLYVADATTNRIHVFDPASRTPVRTWGATGAGFSAPQGIAVASDGTVYVADTNNHRVQRYSPTGTLLATWTSGVSGVAFVNPLAVAVRAGELYVTELNGPRVQVLNATSGAPLRTWGLSGSPSTSRYNRPSGIDVDASGRVVVVDTGKHQIERCDISGNGSTFYGAFGSGTGQLNSPHGAAFSGDTVWVTDSSNDRIARFDTLGSAWLSAWSFGGSAVSGEFTSPRAVAFAPDGSVYVADTANNRIQHFSSSGVLQSVFPTSGPVLSSPAGLAVSPDGTTLFVADTGNNVLRKYSTAGAFMQTIGTPGSGQVQFAGPRQLAFTSSGDLVVADTGNHRVQVIDQAGTFRAEWGGFGNANNQFSSPEGVAVGGIDANIYVADTGNHRVQVFASNGIHVRTFGSFGSGQGSFQSPSSVAVDASGSVFVSERLGNRVQGFTDAGAVVVSFGRTGAQPGDLRGPDGIGAGPGGVIGLADTANHRVQVFGKDTQAPVTTLSGSPVLNAYVNRPVTVTVTATDSASGVAETRYQLGADPVQIYTGPFTVSAEGETLVRTWSVDRAGNIESPVKSAYVRIDTTPPTGTVTFAGGASVVNTTAIGVRSDVTEAALMRLNGGGGYGSWDAFALDATVTAPGEGTQTVAAQYLDSRDNTLTVSRQILVDLTKPTVALSGIPASAITSLAVNVSIAASDTPSGVASIHFIADGSAEQTYTGSPVSFSSEGTHTISARSVDRGGNVSNIATATFVIDRTPPSGTALLAGGAAYSPSLTNTLTVSTADAVDMRVNLGAGYGVWGPVAAASPVTFSAEGTNTATVQLRDAAGNTSVIADSIYVDLTAPLASISGVPAGGITYLDVPLTLSATDFGGSGVAAIRYSLDGAPEATYSATITVTSEGTHTIAYYAVDNVGRAQTPSATATFEIDKTTPTGSVTLAGGAAWIATQAVSIDSSITAATDMAFTVDGAVGSWVPYAGSASRSVIGEGVHAIVARYRSRAGKITTLTPPAVRVDLTAPTTTRSGVADGALIAEDATVSLSATDGAGVGVDRIVYSINGEPEQLYSSTLTISADGTYTVGYAAIDSLGWREATKTVSFEIDTRTPRGAVTVGEGRAFINSEAMRVDLDVILTTEYALEIDGDRGAWTAYEPTTTATFSGEGPHSLIVHLRSRSGVESSVVATVPGVDLTEPEIAIAHPTPVTLINAGAGSWRYITRIAWTSADPEPFASGVASHRWAIGGGTQRVTSGFQAIVTIPMTGGTFAAASLDRAGNYSPTSHFRVGVGATTPAVRSSYMANTAVPVAFSVSKPGGGEEYFVRVYRRTAATSYALTRSVRARAGYANGGWRATARTALAPGTYVVVGEVRNSDNSTLTRPSGPVTIR